MDEDDPNDKEREEEVETQEALERARQKWNDFLLPLQLSLELLANVSSRAVSPGDCDDAEDDRMMMDDYDWGADQEAQWMQEQQQEQERLQKQRVEEEVFQKVLVDSALPGQLMQLFRQIFQLPQPLSTMVFPEQSLVDLEELQSKVMACLGNCWENVSFWPLGVSWAELQQAASTAGGVGKEGLVSAMVIALKTKPSLRKEWQPEHLSFWLRHVTDGVVQGKDSENDAMMKSMDQKHHCQENLSVRRDAITMLAVLCSQEPHPVEVNREVCTTLLSTLTNQSEPLIIQCEILNALMDMYGNDDDDGCCYQSVFESLQVLGHFQRCIPALKSKLKDQEKQFKEDAQRDGSADRLELEQWKETLLNSSRFVQYKKGQL